MSSPLEFLATLNISLVSPLESILFPFVGAAVLITAVWSMTLGPLRGRPDLIFPGLGRAFLITLLIFATPYIGNLLLSAWSVAYSTGYNAAKTNLDDIVQRGDKYFSLMGLVAGGMGATAAKLGSRRLVVQAAGRAQVKIEAEVMEQVAKEAAENNWTKEQIDRRVQELLQYRLHPDVLKAATNKELVSGKGFVNRMDRALNYANWVGVPLMGMLWLFYILGLATGLTIILLKLAWPIGLAVLALSPRSGSYFMARWFNFAIAALATALIVPMIVGLAANIFIGGPVNEVLDRWAQFEHGGWRSWIINGFHLITTSIWSALMIIGGLIMLFIVGGISATAVPSVVGQALISTGLFETALAGRAAVGLLPSRRPVSPMIIRNGPRNPPDSSGKGDKSDSSGKGDKPDSSGKGSTPK